MRSSIVAPCSAVVKACLTTLIRAELQATTKKCDRESDPTFAGDQRFPVIRRTTLIHSFGRSVGDGIMRFSMCGTIDPGWEFLTVQILFRHQVIVDAASTGPHSTLFIRRMAAWITIARLVSTHRRLLH